MGNILAASAPAQPQATMLVLQRITNDGGTQMRAGMDPETIKEYQEAIEASETWPFPPVIVYHDGERYWLADGFHRVNAAHRSGKYLDIPADIRAGTRRDAVLHAAGANASHGLRRTKDDKRRAVETLVRDGEWGKWSNREIARRCSVSEHFVRDIKRDLGIDTAPQAQYTHPKTGETTTMNTANIGAAGQARAAVQPDRRPEMFEIEQVVRQVATAQRVAASDLRLIARLRSGSVWQDVLKGLPANTPYRDITQACNNVAEQMAQRQAAPTPAPDADIHHGAGRVPPPPLRVDDLVEELRPHTESATVAAIELAAHGAYNAVRQRCVTVLTDFSYRGQDLSDALQRIANERMEQDKAAPLAVNGDQPLPAWTEPPVMATVAQTFADVVEVHGGEPAPQDGEPEPVEPLPVSQRSDYESDEWYTPQEYIDAAKAVMGGIDLDPASSELAQTVVKADVYLTRFDNGLGQTRWLHQRIWLNPPYSNPGPWIEKLVREHQAGPFCTEAIVLVNNATETSWFQMLLERFPVCLPARRIAFWRHDHANVGARQGQAFFYLGPNVQRFQEVFSQFGPILRRIG